jgi:tRNA nucleotidyltransferase (CCA-adding enzyme)
MKVDLQGILEKIKFSEQELSGINEKVWDFQKKLLKLAGKNIKIFIGGSYAKGTMLKKDRIDIDIFVIFPKNEKPSEKLSSMLKKGKIKFNVIHGSRDYFQVNFDDIVVELVPIINIKKAQEAMNITDISPLHVSWLLNKIKENEKLKDEIMLSKSFCYACDCYGAESYISGFSGYALEVLTCYYRSFLNFLKQASKWKIEKIDDKKIVIDPEKYYDNEKEILESLNESKQTSPIILIDPVQKERNVTAALNLETLKKFIENAKKFLKNPSEEFFFKKSFNPDAWKKEKGQFFVIKAISFKDKVDTAGAKLKKFYEFLIYKLEKENFSVLEKHFDFNDKSLEARYFFVLKEPPQEILVQGPPIKIEQKYQDNFKKKWTNAFIKNKRLFAKAERRFSSFQELIKIIYKEQMKEMGIKEIKLMD